MKQLAALLTFVLSFGFNFANAGQPGPVQHQPPQQHSNDITPGQVIGAFGSLINAANGSHQNGWNGPSHNNGNNNSHNNGGHNNGGHNNGNQNGHNNGNNGNYNPNIPVVPPPHVEPWQPWQPQHNPNYGQVQTFNSIGSYSTSSEAGAAKDEAVRVMRDLRLNVKEARVFYNSGYRFVVSFTGRGNLDVAKYNAGTYSTSSEARQAANQTVAALRGKGKIVIETPVFYNSGYTYTVAYVDPYGQDQDDQLQKMNSVGSYSTSSEATAARNEAVRVLADMQITVLEARVEYNSGYRYVITYGLREPLPVEEYRGGSYSTSSEARRAAGQTAETLKARGKAVIETPVFYNSGYTYTVAYINLREGHHQGGGQLQTMNSIGSYATSSEANAAKDAAAAVMGALRATVLEARVEYNSGYRFVITYTSRRPLNIEQYRGGSYSTSSEARQAAGQTAAAMRNQGLTVLETPVFYNSGYTYIVGYVSPRW